MPPRENYEHWLSSFKSQSWPVRSDNSFKPSPKRGSTFKPTLRWHAVAGPLWAGLTQALAVMSLSPMLTEDSKPDAPLLWVLGWARGVEREALRSHLGNPLHVETDSTRTFGGDEDWWLYVNDEREKLAICLRVPYGDAVMYSSVQSVSPGPELAKLLAPWSVELFDKVYPR